MVVYGGHEEYPLPALYSSMNVLGTHDTARILNQMNGNAAEVEMAATLQMTWLGMPSVYYGDEAGLAGGGTLGPHDSTIVSAAEKMASTSRPMIAAGTMPKFESTE